jgi:hypothetical protein
VAKIVAGLVVFVPYFGVAIVREVVLHPQLILDSFLHSFVTALLPPLGFVILQCILPVTCMVYMCSRRALLWIEDTVLDPMLAPVEFRIWQVTCKTVATTAAVWRRRTWRRVSEKMSLWGAFWYTRLVCSRVAWCMGQFGGLTTACLRRALDVVFLALRTGRVVSMMWSEVAGRLCRLAQEWLVVRLHPVQEALRRANSIVTPMFRDLMSAVVKTWSAVSWRLVFAMGAARRVAERALYVVASPALAIALRLRSLLDELARQVRGLMSAMVRVANWLGI